MFAGSFCLPPVVSGTPCTDWREVPTPNFGTVLDQVVDADANGGPVILLVASKDNTIVNGDQHFHVLRRTGGGWEDLGESDVAALEAASFGNEGVIWTAVAAGSDGTIWLAGEHEPLAQVNRGYQRPVLAAWSESNWSEPESFPLAPVTEYPYPPRGGSVRDMGVAADGTIIAVGQASGWGGLVEINGSIPLLLRNAGSRWEELNVPDRDWPGNRGSTYADEVVVFGVNEIVAVGRHPGGNGVGVGALLVGYDEDNGPFMIGTPADGSQPASQRRWWLMALTPAGRPTSGSWARVAPGRTPRC